MLTSKDEPLLIWGDSLLVLDLRLHILDRVRWLNLDDNKKQCSVGTKSTSATKKLITLFKLAQTMLAGRMVKLIAGDDSLSLFIGDLQM